MTLSIFGLRHSHLLKRDIPTFPGSTLSRLEKFCVDRYKIWLHHLGMWVVVWVELPNLETSWIRNFTKNTPKKNTTALQMTIIAIYEILILVNSSDTNDIAILWAKYITEPLFFLSALCIKWGGVVRPKVNNSGLLMSWSLSLLWLGYRFSVNFTIICKNPEVLSLRAQSYLKNEPSHRPWDKWYSRGLQWSYKNNYLGAATRQKHNINLLFPVIPMAEQHIRKSKTLVKYLFSPLPGLPLCQYDNDGISAPICTWNIPDIDSIKMQTLRCPRFFAAVYRTTSLFLFIAFFV